MPAQIPDCPTCKKPMTPDHPFIEHEPKSEEIPLGQPFPSEIEIRMFQNYICNECGTRMKQAVQVAIYKNPEVKELLPP